MKIVVAANVGEGRGRSSVIMSLATSLINEKKRVLIVDLYPQEKGGIASHFIEQDDVLRAQATLFDALCDQSLEPFQVTPYLSLLVGSPTLFEANNSLALQKNPKTFLQSFFRAWQYSQCFDYCLIDSNANQDCLTTSAFIAADGVVIPQWVRSGFDLDYAKQQVETTVEAICSLRTEQSLPTQEVLFLIEQPLEELDRGNWNSFTTHLLTRLDAA